MPKRSALAVSLVLLWVAQGSVSSSSDSVREAVVKVLHTLQDAWVRFKRTPGIDLEVAICEEYERVADQLIRDLDHEVDKALDLLVSMLAHPEETEFEGLDTVHVGGLLATLARARGRVPEVAKKLLKLLPTSEEVWDTIVAGAVVDLGPDAYDTLAECARNSRNRARATLCGLVLFLVSKETSFANYAGIEPSGDGLPLSAVRRIGKKWPEWWKKERGNYVWSPAEPKLKPRCEGSSPER